MSKNWISWHNPPTKAQSARISTFFRLSTRNVYVSKLTSNENNKGTLLCSVCLFMMDGGRSVTRCSLRSWRNTTKKTSTTVRRPSLTGNKKASSYCFEYIFHTYLTSFHERVHHFRLVVQNVVYHIYRNVIDFSQSVSEFTVFYRFEFRKFILAYYFTLY
jgi:hypothetical protein